VDGALHSRETDVVMTDLCVRNNIDEHWKFRRIKPEWHEKAQNTVMQTTSNSISMQVRKDW